MPTSRSNHDPERAVRWEATRASVGARIRALRLDRGLTQEQVALVSGVARHMLVQVERGQRGLLYERLVDIADALDVHPSTLLEDL
ncbi:helix-turn-helix domain-containing protein [Mycolicibacterium sp. CBMA 234]|uniref:helix-turn-helix domain-containing protein n=1 Tax=Mycolicibacterium sp. CBMA 234 TaxID=1918495 RepID=UPI0013912E38|nr:helix-turn-helix transcriptional regulator [Mycolicibacterium sp. CBMA 234]